MTEPAIRRALAAAVEITADSSNPFNGAAEITMPDFSVLNESRREPPALPLELFGGAWKRWISDAAECCSAPRDYIAAAVLSAAGAMIGNTRWPQPWPGWQEPPVLWFALIGLPSSGKSPAQDAVTDALRVIENDWAADFPERLRKWQGETEAAKFARLVWQSEVKDAVKDGTPPPEMPEAAVEPERPARPRILISDSTPEEMGALLATSAKGLVFHRDELTGWLTSFDRYSAGGERAFWIESFGGRPYVIDRVKFAGNPIRIPHLSMTVLGGIQPDRLASGLLAGDDDGLAARLVCVWPDPITPRRPRAIPNRDFAVAAFRRLGGLTMRTDHNGNPTFSAVPFSEEAATVLESWRASHVQAQQDTAGRYASHLGKFPGLFIRLALVLEYLWWSASDGSEPTHVSNRAAVAAACLLTDYIGPMAERAYGDAAIPEPERHAATVAKWILRTRPAVVNARALRRTARLPGLREAAKVRAALEVLIEAGWLHRPAAGSGHRPREDYPVNPAVYSRT